MDRAQGRKKSQFPVVTSVPSGAYQDVFNDGVNYKILYSDYLAGLGVTGTIQEDGAATGTSVLFVDGTDYYIRNIEDGSGILSSVSAENGITLEHNFTADATGVPLLVDVTEDSPTVVSAVAGTGIQIAASGDSVIITATGVTAPTNEVVVNLESEFPEQDATTITLQSKVNTILGADISTAKRFIVEDGAVFTGRNQFGSTITYTGTGDMFTSTDANVTIEDIRIDSPTAAQTFNVSDTTGGKILAIRNVSIDNTPKWGTYDGFLTTITTNSSSLNADDGVTITGTGQLVTNMQEFGLVSTSATMKLVDFGTAIVPNIEINNLVLVAPTGAFLISGLASNGNVPSGSLAMVTNSSVVAGATALENITADDFRWDFVGNSTIPDTRPDGLIGLFGNGLTTTISASSTDGTNAVIINATTWNEETASHFTTTTGGRVTYDGERDFTAPIDITVNANMASGGSNTIAAYLAINGVVQQASQGLATVTPSQPGTMVCQWQHTFTNGDYVEVYIENQGGTTNIDVTSGVLRVN